MSHKKLFLLRHAQATPPSIYQPDHERLLTKVGAQQVTELGIAWQQQGLQFHQIVTSPALRTKLTAQRIAQEMAHDAQHITTDRTLYEGTATAVVDKIRAWPAEWQQVLVVTHLPVVQALLTYLTGHLPYQSIAPGSCTPIQLSVSAWQQVTEGVGKL